jgi:hypothetical protein
VGSGSSTPSDGAPLSGQGAGTITSFEGGTLTITLSDGGTVSGKVTEETEIRCKSSAPPTGGDGEDGEGSGSAGDGNAGHMGDSAVSPHDTGGEGGEDGGAGGGGSEDGSEACTTAALVPGASVAEAELSLEGSGAVWDHVDVIQ